MPPRIEEYVRESAPVRFVDAFVEQLDLAALGFERAGGGGNRTAWIPAGGSVKVVRVWLPATHPVESAPGGRSGPQSGSDVAVAGAAT